MDSIWESRQGQRVANAAQLDVLGSEARPAPGPSSNIGGRRTEREKERERGTGLHGDHMQVHQQRVTCPQCQKGKRDGHVKREREGERERETDREKEKEREREGVGAEGAEEKKK